MTKTLSIDVCKKLAEMGVKVESYWCWQRRLESQNWGIGKNEVSSIWRTIPAYTLDCIPEVLKAILQITPVDLREFSKNPNFFTHSGLVTENRWKEHWLQICELFPTEGMEGVDKYVLNLIEK